MLAIRAQSCLAMTPAPTTLAKVARTSEVIAWLRDMATQLANTPLSPCPATPLVAQRPPLPLI